MTGKEWQKTVLFTRTVQQEKAGRTPLRKRQPNSIPSYSRHYPLSFSLCIFLKPRDSLNFVNLVSYRPKTNNKQKTRMLVPICKSMTHLVSYHTMVPQTRQSLPYLFHRSLMKGTISIFPVQRCHETKVLKAGVQHFSCLGGNIYLTNRH